MRGVRPGRFAPQRYIKPWNRCRLLPDRPDVMAPFPMGEAVLLELIRFTD